MRFWFWCQPPCVLRTILVNLKSGETLSGVLWSVRGRWWTLRKAALLKAGQPPTTIDGDVIVDRDNVDFTQVLP